ncbi:MAG: hypothetical protein CFE38_17405 [Comamonadaceae bacterium PBBC1]|nr:MAG: hypothetical protein CFE38_17405 [Comamonadaceae bacterium PBBC1]
MPLYTEKEMQDRQAGALGAIGLVLFLAVAFVNAPGMLLLAFIKDVSGPALDIGQMWTFSLIASVLFLGTSRVMVENWSEAFKLYIIMCVAVTAFFLVCNFGFKAEFPARYLGFFF